MRLHLSLLLLICSSAFSQQRTIQYTPALDVNALDRSADPCVDFYQFSCGGWIKNNPLPADQSTWSVYGKLQEQNQFILQQVLENASRESATRGPVQQKIGDYYAACMDDSAIQAAGIKPLQMDLHRIAELRSIRELAGYLANYHARDVFTVLPTATVF